MKKLTFIFVALLFGLSSLFAQDRADILRQGLLDRRQDKVYVVAHRGDWINYPENSIGSIVSIIDMGGDVVEIDIQRTKDSVLVLMHDVTLDRTTNGTGLVSDMTYKQIKKLRLKDHKGNLTKHKIPTLEEALEVSKGKILLNLDKADRFFDQVGPMLEETGTLNLVILKSYNKLSVAKETLGKYFDKVIYMPMIRFNRENSMEDLAAFLQELNPVAFELGYNSDTNPLPKKAKEVIGTRSLMWYNTLNGRNGGHDDATAATDPQKGYGYLIDTLGARMLQTDTPEYMIEYLRKRGMHE